MLLSLWFACGALCKTIKTKLVLDANDKAEHSKKKACLTLSFKKTTEWKRKRPPEKQILDTSEPMLMLILNVNVTFSVTQFSFKILIFFHRNIFYPCMLSQNLPPQKNQKTRGRDVIRFYIVALHHLRLLLIKRG